MIIDYGLVGLLPHHTFSTHHIPSHPVPNSLHLLTMLQLNARVLAVEPNARLCFSAKFSVHALGRERQARIVCGAVAADGGAIRGQGLSGLR
jgi:hypothetical protein